MAVVGGGNSAGQAAVFLAATTRAVHLLVRDHSLGAKMSQYLADQIEGDPRITVMTHTEIRELHGDQFLTAIEVEDTTTGSRKDLAVRALFVFIGAEPQSSWLTGAVELDRGPGATRPDSACTGPARASRARASSPDCRSLRHSRHRASRPVCRIQNQSGRTKLLRYRR